MTLLPEAAETVTRGRTGHQKEIGEQIRTSTTSSEDQLTRTEDITTRAVGGRTLLNIPPCSMAEEPGEQSQSPLPTAHERSGIKSGTPTWCKA